MGDAIDSIKKPFVNSIVYNTLINNNNCQCVTNIDAEVYDYNKIENCIKGNQNLIM